MTVHSLKRLTPAQRARLPEWRDKWIAIGLSTEPADRPRAEAAYRACYRAAKLRDTVPIVWVDSPLVGALAATLAAQIIARPPKPAISSAVDGADSAVRSTVSSAVSSAVYSAVDSAIYSAIDSAIYSAVYRAANSAVGSAVDGAISSGWQDWLGGSLWVEWPAFESFFREVCGFAMPGGLTDAAAAYAETSLAACYWWPNRSFIIACERPRLIRRDTRGRLHCETGHAIEWPDGWGLSSWHGVTIPDEWLADKSALTPQIALTAVNLEQRRAACEIVGWDRILAQLHGHIIDTDADPQIGELIEVDLPDGGPSRFLRVLCGTSRRFVIPVPLSMQTALEANAACYDIPPDLLKLKEHRT